MASLEKSLLQTISFFDILNMPLRVTDVWQYLWRHRATKQEVQQALDVLVSEKKLEHVDDFYVVPTSPPYEGGARGGSHLVLSYVEAQSVQKRLWRRALTAKRWLQWVPFVRCICVCNSLAFGNPNKKSDIDLLIVVESGHLWHARFLCSAYMQLRGIRRHGKKIAGRICLSFFVTTDVLDFSKIKIADDDVYLSYWVRTLKPIFGIETYRTLMQQNKWIDQDIPNFSHVRTTSLFPPSRAATWYQGLDEKFLKITGLEKLSEKILRSRYKPRVERKAEQLEHSAGTVIGDTMLKFHDRDRRGEIRERWKDLQRT